jgi:hypothetical protein
MSVGVAIVLLVSYALGLLFSLRTHKDLFNPEQDDDDAHGEPWSVRRSILALALAGDYLTDYVDPLDAGVLVLSLIGVAATCAAFWLLQGYLARRLPQRRVRKGECPFCAFPVRGNAHCEGCGRDVIAPCARCERPRRVGTRFCAACGQS